MGLGFRDYSGKNPSLLRSSKALLKEVIDLSPGSGTLASVCLSPGLRYVGFCAIEKHRKWLENLVEKQALTLAVTQGHALWTQALPDLIRLHFQDIVSAGDEGGNGDLNPKP